MNKPVNGDCTPTRETERMKGEGIQCIKKKERKKKKGRKKERRRRKVPL
jgi:hypothetical protein